MALNKVTYVDGSTKIKAENLNNIQDSIIANEQSIAALKLTEAEDGVELLGQTPITLSSDVSTLLLSAKAVAKEYHIPYIDGYHGLGINKINASMFLSDGTHFNDIGRQRFGTFIGSQIISNM